MKYAFMSFSCPESTLDEMLAVAGKYGYDGIEPRINPSHKHGISPDITSDARREIRAKITDGGISLCCLATSCNYSDPARTQKQIEQTLRLADLCGDIGAPRMRIFGGNIPDGISREDAIKRLADALWSVADHALQRGVTLCMETHDIKGWCDPLHVAEVMRRVNHPAVAANWDIMHPIFYAGKTMDEAFEALKPWIRHVHFHDGIKVGDQPELCPIGKGAIDHRRAVQLLKTIPYDGFLSGEWISWEPYETALPRELAAMKRYEEETV